MNTPMGTEEVEFRSINGYVPALIILVTVLAVPAVVISQATSEDPNLVLAGITVLVGVPLIIFLAAGFYMLQPNQSALMMLFGSYRGTDYNTGLRWANPFMRKTKVSLRLRNFNSEKLKVNDKRGNPIEIAAAIVWKVSDTARAVLDIDDYERYVPVQAEAAVRHLANEYSYDAHDDEQAELTLRGGGDEIVGRLKRELQERFEKAGLRIEDARLTHLAYAPEIAGAMLRRQQAEAVIGARKQIVLGAVSMVEMALKGLTERGVVELDDERRAAMVSNLLVVLCAESEAQPVINAGSLYQ
ncbi:MAG TPA: SPFH domain-containing protein [Burkholderiales bacterium]|jgi:regulator of protease activity HflC (stomatin/prohibitin superfamily)|nr:SPFH domain-containing protein [Burkholderiales bacterium]